MSEFTITESKERLVEGIKKAADRALEMGKAQDRVEWFLIAQQLHLAMKKSIEYINGEPLTAYETELWLEIVDTLNKHFPRE